MHYRSCEESEGLCTECTVQYALPGCTRLVLFLHRSGVSSQPAALDDRHGRLIDTQIEHRAWIISHVLWHLIAETLVVFRL